MKFRLATLMIAVSLAQLPRLAHGAIDIPPVPLQTGSSVAPNLFYMLDDSGSMQWEIMPENYLYAYYMFPPPGEGQGKDYGGAHVYGGEMYPYIVIKFDTATNQAVYLRSSAVNVLYYNPMQTYQPWAKYDGTSFPDADPKLAYYNPYEPGRGSLNLTQRQTRSAYWNNDGWSSHSFWPMTFYVYKGSGSKTSMSSYIRYQYRNGSIYEWDLSKNNEKALSTMPWGRTVGQELQNFANWFSYYRSRILAVRAGTSLAFSTLGDNFRVGFATIHQTGWKHPPPNNDGFTLNERLDFFTRLFQIPISTAGTPLRSGLDAIGRQIETNLDYFRPDPALSCRQNFAILTTDGYWNDNFSIPDQQNQDGTDGSLITHADGETTYRYEPERPYSDPWSNTLADVAMKYWKRDLRTDLKNDVATTSADPAFWQHMTTYALSLGVQGTLDPQTDLPDLISGGKTWPNPTSSDSAKIDDLWHATINGHGEFISAQDPQEFAEGLRKTLGSIASRTASASNASGNSTSIETGSLVYQARFNSGDWTGELLAYPITGTGLAATPSWNAAEEIPPHSTRKIFTINSKDQSIEFTWNSLDDTQQELLTSEDILAYLRGDQSQELSNGGHFRNRDVLLGDIINSSPVYSKATETIYIGANDGMLHAFDALTGEERFAYVPVGVYPYLKQLSDPNYSHRYYVDGDIVVSDPVYTDGHAYLVAALGRGGKGLFGLDVTSPSSFQKNDVLWDHTASNDDDMGYILGQIVMTNVDGLGWRIITGNGINSTNEHAVLYIIDPATGKIDAKIDTGAGSPEASNGLSSPTIFDADGDGDADIAYAGDQLGNLWRFDLTSKQVALNGQPLYVAKNADNQLQPINGQPLAVRNDVSADPNRGKVFVFFGTGRFLTMDDLNDKTVQSWYGLIDEDLPITGREVLQQRTISYAATTEDGDIVRTFSEEQPNDMVDKKGWFVDLKTNNVAEGERMIGSQLYLRTINPVLLASSIIPEGDPCTPGGRGYVNAINPFTGARLRFTFFDVNDDASFDQSDKMPYSGTLVDISSIDFRIGMPSDPFLMGNRLIISGTTGLPSILINLVTNPRRLSWREIIAN